MKDIPLPAYVWLARRGRDDQTGVAELWSAQLRIDAPKARQCSAHRSGYYRRRMSNGSYFDKSMNSKSASVSSPQGAADGSAQTNFLECKIALFTTAFFILLPTSTWAGLIASDFLFGYFWFWLIQ